MRAMAQHRFGRSQAYGTAQTYRGWPHQAITWKRDDGGLDKLGIIPSARGIRFVKRDDHGELAGLFVPYFHTPTMFGGYRRWFACPGCRRPARILYGVHTLRCRRCRGLKYASQSEASHWRAQRKALSIRRRVGASGDALDDEAVLRVFLQPF